MLGLGNADIQVTSCSSDPLKMTIEMTARSVGLESLSYSFLHDITACAYNLEQENDLPNCPSCVVPLTAPGHTFDPLRLGLFFSTLALLLILCLVASVALIVYSRYVSWLRSGCRMLTSVGQSANSKNAFGIN